MTKDRRKRRGAPVDDGEPPMAETADDLATELSPRELVTVAGDDRDVGSGDPSPAEVEAQPSLVDVRPEGPREKLPMKRYEKELATLQVELVKLEEWIRHAGLKVVVLFEGRDAAGKGGAIKTITYSLNPRVARVVALGVPSDREKTQWYFQRYVAHLPAAGEIVFFDRSWYNRGGVERVMGFCDEEEYQEFLRSCPEFERMLVRSGIILIKYWFSVSPDEQERRFQARADDPTKRWKLSPVDLASRMHWDEYSRAKDALFAYTDIKQAPWYVVDADDKRRARLNVIRHLLSLVPYEEIPTPPIELPERPRPRRGYMRPPKTDQTYVPSVY
jgi:polyphosphate kinase 2